MEKQSPNKQGARDSASARVDPADHGDREVVRDSEEATHTDDGEDEDEGQDQKMSSVQAKRDEAGRPKTLKTEDRKLRRIMSNRRSAKESRERRKKYMDDLEVQLEQFYKENKSLKKENGELRKLVETLLPHVNRFPLMNQQQAVSPNLSVLEANLDNRRLRSGLPSLQGAAPTTFQSLMSARVNSGGLSTSLNASLADILHANRNASLDSERRLFSTVMGKAGPLGASPSRASAAAGSIGSRMLGAPGPSPVSAASSLFAQAMSDQQSNNADTELLKALAQKMGSPKPPAPPPR